MQILLLSDIHGNFPALLAITEYFKKKNFDLACNCGDSIVYAPFPNETLHWLEENNVSSILGNTDRKIKKLLSGKQFKKPGKPEKRIMYTWTAEQLDKRSKNYLLSLKKQQMIQTKYQRINLFHGSPEHPNEFIFPDTPISRFVALSKGYNNAIIVTGHSHTPYYKQVADTHFINPGSVGRMFDSDPSASCAVLTLDKNRVSVKHYRIPYSVEQTIAALAKHKLPDIYQTMYMLGQKLN